MPTFETKIKSRKEIAEKTFAFYIEKPAGFEYKAGQHVELILPGTQDDTRSLSLASAPHEFDLMVAIRQRKSKFKETLMALPDGATVTINGPFGLFFLHEDTSRPAVFLAGGIGVTIFRSLVMDALERRTGHTIYLFSVNRRLQDAPFFTEFEQRATKENIHFIPTLTQADFLWKGEQGRISQPMLQKYVNDILLPVYYVAGPMQMVASTYQMLRSAGIKSQDIRTEQFTGY